MPPVTTKAQLLLDQTAENMANYAILLRGPYSQRDLAELLHVKQQSISDWEAGLARPMAKQLRALLTHFLGWYETDRLEYAAALALKLLPPKKHLTTTTRAARTPTKAKHTTRSPRKLRRT